jgi:acyl carrier protein
VRHVFSSREPGLSAAVLERTGGAGVDVVLNSLTGEFIPESLRLLAPGGRFVEIGKREIWTPEQVAAVRADVTYTAFDLVELSRDEPAAIRAMLTTLLERLAAGELRPLPRRVFGLPRAADAFRFMAQARHTGKLVISHDPGAGLVRPDGAYLITGGLGGLGLRVARRLVDRGARSLVLVGRSGGTDATAAEIAALRSTGADVAVVQADIADQDAVDRLVAGIPRLRGVIHAAGVLDDGVLLQQRPDRFARVLAPKVAGARNLDRATRDRNLDFFVLFSSIAAVLGAAGQGNYAAANAYLDLLAAQRRRAGRPGLSLAWGPWRGAGMAAERDGDWWTGRGMQLVEPEQGLDLLERAIADGPAQLAVAVVDWQAYLRPFGSAPPPLLRDLADAARAAGPDTLPLADRLAGLAAGDRPEAITDHVRELAAGVLGVAAAHTLDPHTPLNELGLDSLMAVELRNALSRGIGRPLPATLLFDYPTVDALARFVTAGLEPEPASGPAPDPAQERTARDVMVAEIRQLSDAEVEALLEQELSRPRRQDSHD